MIARLIEFPARIGWDTAKPNGQPRRKLDTSLSIEVFSFESAIPIEEELHRTIVWYCSTSGLQ